MNSRNPPLSIPPLPAGALSTRNPSSSAHTQTDEPGYYDYNETPTSSTIQFPVPWDRRPSPLNNELEFNVFPASRPPSRSATYEPPSIAFPEPTIFRSISANAPLSPYPPPGRSHRYSKSDGAVDVSSVLGLHRGSSALSVASSAYYGSEEMAISDESYASGVDEITEQVSEMSLQSEEGLDLFQRGLLTDNDQEWHKLVPKEALNALPKNEVTRQSVMFELIKSEREYVSDLETVVEVFIQPLIASSPPVIPPQVVYTFLDNIFGNVRKILGHHQRMLAALFARQRDTHPLLQSIADIILDSVVMEDLRNQYESYIKHYPIAESHHRQEMRRNPKYREFMQASASHPNLRKRDLVTFLSRPVTRLPRLKLLLDTILKATDKEYEHPDLETLPLISDILSAVIKGTQPGIEAAESKVKFWELCESLVFRRGEIIDMDLYDARRTLLHDGPVVRKAKSDTSSSTSQLVLLDHYVLIVKEDKRANGVMKRLLISRPIPLDYLRLGSFNAPSELKHDPNDDSLLARRNIPMYPFTLYHAYSTVERRYTLYVASDTLRNKWRAHFQDALGVYRVYQEANVYFNSQTLSDNSFWYPPSQAAFQGSSSSSTMQSNDLLGRILCAVPFTSHDRRFIAVGSLNGIYVAPRGSDRFRKVLGYRNVTSILAVQSMGHKVFNKFMLLVDSTLISYSLDLVARVALGEAEHKTLNASLEHIAGGDTNVLFVKQAVVMGRMLVIYASRKFLSSSVHLHSLEVLDVTHLTMRPNRINHANASRSFRVLGEPGYVPKDTFDISTLNKMIGVCTQDGVLIMNPIDLGRSQAALIPDMRDSNADMVMAALKHRIEIAERAKPLGLVKCGDNGELLVVYDKLGVYITRHGVPTRNSGFVKWEILATHFACSGPRILLFSPSFIEVRNITSGSFLQTIEGRDIRLLWNPSNLGGTNEFDSEPILVTMRGAEEKKDGSSRMSDKIVELLETREISRTGPGGDVRPPPVPPKDTVGTKLQTPVSAPALWAEWDM